MFNNLTIQGNLVDKPVYRQAQGDGKSSCWGKIGVYQGKDQQGNELDSMFIEFTCFGVEADTMAQCSNKGDLVVASGRFSETKSVGNNGQTYINKRIVGNARLCYKIQANNNGVPTNTQNQNMQQAQTYQAPVNNYQAPVNNNQAPVNNNPWGN